MIDLLITHFDSELSDINELVIKSCVPFTHGNIISLDSFDSSLQENVHELKMKATNSRMVTRREARRPSKCRGT